VTVSAPGARLAAAFARRRADDLPGLVPYVTAGYPRLSDTPDLLKAAERAGCVAAEVGIPFSDPLADGPTIQRSGQQALSNGITVNHVLDQVAQARGAGVSLPLALMTYVNPVLAYGQARFCADAAGAGADALIVPDLPAGEAAELHALTERSGLALIFMVAPTTTEARLRDVCASGSGFVYCVGVTGITGARSQISEEAIELLTRVHGVTDLPRALGFGLSRHEHLEALRGHAEAAVVGSALIDAIAAAGADTVGAVERFLGAMLQGGTD
jgi:tryptophan synthase alpha chain